MHFVSWDDLFARFGGGQVQRAERMKHGCIKVKHKNEKEDEKQRKRIDAKRKEELALLIERAEYQKTLRSHYIVAQEGKNKTTGGLRDSMDNEISQTVDKLQSNRVSNSTHCTHDASMLLFRHERNAAFSQICRWSSLSPCKACSTSRKSSSFLIAS